MNCKIYKLMLGVMVTPVMPGSEQLKQEASPGYDAQLVSKKIK
jgi:hypothetical protein